MNIRKIRENYPQVIPNKFTFSTMFLGEVKKERKNVVLRNHSRANQYK